MTRSASALLAGLVLVAALSGLGATIPQNLPRALESPADTGSAAPNLAVGPEGDVWMSWLARRPRGGHALEIARLEGERWSSPLTVVVSDSFSVTGDSLIVNGSDVPGVLPLGGRKLAAYWLWRSAAGEEGYDVHVGLSSDLGRTWGHPIEPHHDHTPIEHGMVSMLPEADGVRVLWLDGRDFARPPARDSNEVARGAQLHDELGLKGETSLRTALIRGDGSIAEEGVLDPRVCDCCQTAAVRVEGGILAAYRDRTSDETRDISLVARAESVWSEPRPLHLDRWKIEGCPVNGPALDASGPRVVAAWYSRASERDRVWVAFSDDRGASFGPPMRVDQGFALGRVDVVLLESGDALVSWLEGSGKNTDIKVRRVGRRDVTDAPIVLARTVASRASGWPRMVRSGGRIVFAWTVPGKPSRIETAVLEMGD